MLVGKPLFYRFSATAMLLSSVGITSTLRAQALPEPPQNLNIDRNSVDVLSGTLQIDRPLVEIGNGAGVLQFSLHLRTASTPPFGSVPPNTCLAAFTTPVRPCGILMADNNAINLKGGYVTNQGGQSVLQSATIVFNTRTYQFLASSGQFTPTVKSMGSSLRYDTSLAQYVFTDRDGVALTFERNDSSSSRVESHVKKISFPNGMVIDYLYNYDVAVNKFGTGVSISSPVFRISGIKSNLGWSLKYVYSTTSTDSPSWNLPQNVYAVNSAQSYCDVATTCDPPAGSLSTSISYNFNSQVFLTKITATDAGAGVYVYNLPDPQARPSLANYIISSKSAASSTNDIAYGYETLTKIISVGNIDGTTSYAYSDSTNGSVSSQGYSRLVTVTNPAGGVTNYMTFGKQEFSRVSKMTDPNGNVTQYEYDDVLDKITKVIFPEGNYDTYTYDARGNLTSKKRYPKSIGPAIVLTEAAVYSTSCTNIVVCNKPTAIIDANGRQTDYAYDPVHGGVTSVTAPADTGGVRAQIRYSYTQRYARLKTSSGGYTLSATPIWLLASEAFCKTTAASGTGCSGGSADEVVTTYDYGPDSGANNLNLLGIAVSSNGQTLRTCYSYDRWGRRISETQPNANFASCS